MAYKHCRKFQSPELGARTLQTTDRRQTDDKRQTDGRTTPLIKTVKDHQMTSDRNKIVHVYRK